MRLQILLLVTCLVACRKEEKSVYYDLHDARYQQPVGAYRLYNTGFCEYYHYNRTDKNRTIFSSDDVIEAHEWSYNVDKLILMGRKYQIRDIKNDTLFIISKNGDADRLVKSPQQ